MRKPDISIVIPLYNEAENIAELHRRVKALIDNGGPVTEVVFVDDGSTDGSAAHLTAIAVQDKRFQLIALSRNFGHQIAISAGLKHARASKAVFIMDGDLQDPPELLPQFWDRMQQGYDVVYGVRETRKEGFVKRIAYKQFYRFISRITPIELPLDSGDFSLISKRVVDVINMMPEESRYLRGMRAWAGFRQTGLAYQRAERNAGNPKYSFRSLFQLAYNGIFNFSEFPVKMITYSGFVAFSISVLYSLHVLYMRFFHGDVPQGFTALLFSIVMFGGIQLMSVGILGEYITRIYFQTRNRPLYIVNHKITDGQKSSEVDQFSDTVQNSPDAF